MQVKRNIIVSVALIMSFFQVAFTRNATGNEYYEKAYTEMANMLEGKSPISIRRAVFMAEWAYLDGNLDYEKDFCEPILKDVAYMKRWMNANNLSQYKTAKQMTLCNFFFYPSGLTTGESGITLLPGQGMSGVNSPNQDAYTYIHPSLSPFGQAEALSHELYGHGSLYNQYRDRRVSGHDYRKTSRDHNDLLRNNIRRARMETVSYFK